MENLFKKKVLITGGLGHIGSFLVDRLRGSYKIMVFDQRMKNQIPADFSLNNIEIINGNVKNFDEVFKAMSGCKIVFHLAGVLGSDYLVNFPLVAEQTNTQGTINVLEAARKLNISKVIITSLYHNWINPYMISKLAADQYAMFYAHEFGLPISIARFGHVFGPRQKWQPVRKAVPNFIRQALLGEDLIIYGKGGQIMDLLYVKDAANALQMISESKTAIGQIFEIGSGDNQAMTLLELAKDIISKCNSKSKIIHKNMRQGEPDDKNVHRLADTSKTKRILGFSPQYSYKEAIKKTINWHRRFTI